MIYSSSLTRDIQKFCDAVELLDICEGDILQHPCDIIVCPDGKELNGKGGLAKKIHKSAGPLLKKALAAVGECYTGQVYATEAFHLNSKYIIHAVSPKWEGGKNKEEYQLAHCYAAAIQKTSDLHCISIAFPSIGTGCHNFPKKRAAEIAINTILYNLTIIPESIQVSIVCANHETCEIYKNAFKQSIVKMFSEYYSPESYVCNHLSEQDMGPYFLWMVKLKNLETVEYNYSDYLDLIGFNQETATELTTDQFYYTLSSNAYLWDYRTCLAYITYLQRKSYWDGYISYHAEQCKLGGVRKVLLRMQQLLQ